MNKKIILVLFVAIFMTPIVVKGETVTRGELEDYVVSTALSYYYNNANTDYEGFWAEDSRSTYTVNYNYTPEMVSRSRVLTTQCMAFAVTTYMHSLGYDFREYNGLLDDYDYTYYKDKDGNINHSSGNEEIMENAYKYFSKVYQVSLGHKIARLDNDDMGIVTYQKDVISTFPDIEDSSEVITNMSENDQATLVNHFVENLRPGDIILNNGHAMLWVGDALEDEGGIIHSTGYTFSFKDNQTFSPREGVTFNWIGNGYDTAAVYYSSKDYLINKQVLHHGGSENTKISIIRPINAFCGRGTDENDLCEISTIQENTKARSKFKNLKVEEYVYNATDGTTMSVDTSSINSDDLLSYKLSLKNESGSYLCTAPIIASSINQTNCLSKSAEWKQNNNSENYSNLKIVASIPNNTEFVDCNGCSVNSDGSVSWENISVNIGDDEKEYYYIVKPTVNNIVVTNEGFALTKTDDNTTLKMAEMKTRINDSIVGKYRSKLRSMIDSDLDNSNLAKYTSPQAYIADLYQRFYSENTSVLANTFANILDGNKIANAIFKKNSFDEYYIKKTESEINSLDETSKIINKMMVPHFYGGKKYEQLYFENGMDYYRRVIPLYFSGKTNFNYGDIIVTLKQENDNYTISNAFLYTGDEGNLTFTYYNDSNLVKYKTSQVTVHTAGEADTSKKYTANSFFMAEIYSADLYVVLRPTQYYDVDMINVPDDVIEADTARNPKTGIIEFMGIMFVLVACLAIIYSYRKKTLKLNA